MNLTRIRIALFALLMLLVALPVFTAGTNPDRPTRRPIFDGGGGDGPGEITCTIIYRYLCSQTGSCASDSHDSACCNDCEDERGKPLPCGTCIVN